VDKRWLDCMSDERTKDGYHGADPNGQHPPYTEPEHLTYLLEDAYDKGLMSNVGYWMRLLKAATEAKHGTKEIS
jgi:hypothetical protein